jgi:hypothetical protein
MWERRRGRRRTIVYDTSTTTIDGVREGKGKEISSLTLLKLFIRIYVGMNIEMKL